LAEGLSDVELSHEQTLKYAAIGSKGLTRLILNYLRALKAGTAVNA
jgi:xanthosine phosphorylase